MTIKVKIFSRETNKEQEIKVNDFIKSIKDEDFISANFTGDNTVMVVYKSNFDTYTGLGAI